jgi:hypothetical protein
VGQDWEFVVETYFFKIFIMPFCCLLGWTLVLFSRKWTHTYNPSYSGGRNQEDHDSKPAQASSSQDPSSKNSSQKRAGGVAQGLGPEFKSQYCKKVNFILILGFSLYLQYLKCHQYVSYCDFFLFIVFDIARIISIWKLIQFTSWQFSCVTFFSVWCLLQSPILLEFLYVQLE